MAPRKGRISSVGLPCSVTMKVSQEASACLKNSSALALNWEFETKVVFAICLRSQEHGHNEAEAVFAYLRLRQLLCYYKDDVVVKGRFQNRIQTRPHSKLFINNRPPANTRASIADLATICSPTGKPAAANPQGGDIDGPAITLIAQAIASY